MTFHNKNWFTLFTTGLFPYFSEIQAFKNENNLLKQQNNELVLSLKSQIDQLNKQLTEQEKIANEKLSMFENRIKELVSMF